MAATQSTQGLNTVRDWVRWGASAFSRAGLYFGHGTDNALDEAYHLVLAALHLPFDLPAVYLEASICPEEAQAVSALLHKRIQTRLPAPYLLGRIDFCGMEFEIDQSVLIPRSPIGEMIAQDFQPWLTETPQSILDLCAGSGCIGIACAAQFPDSRVDLVEINSKAAAVCERNIEKHGLEQRCCCVVSDLFAQLGGATYDLIVSNPPYVPQSVWVELPDEYQHEPRIALEAGADGMALVEQILHQAADYLKTDGLLVCEIGAFTQEFEQRFERFPATWPEFENGGGGVFVVGGEDLMRWREQR